MEISQRHVQLQSYNKHSCRYLFNIFISLHYFTQKIRITYLSIRAKMKKCRLQSLSTIVSTTGIPESLVLHLDVPTVFSDGTVRSAQVTKMNVVYIWLFFIIWRASIYLSDGYEIKFFDEENYKKVTNGSFRHYYYKRGERVYLSQVTWGYDVSALERRSRLQCITVCRQVTCEDEFLSVHQLVRVAPNVVELLERASSFEDCNPEKVKQELNSRPTFFLKVLDRKNRDASQTIEVKAGECESRSIESTSSVNTQTDCFVLFDDSDCKGNRKYIFTDLTSKGESPWEKNLAQAGLNKGVASVKTCDLAFHLPCKLCPKFLYDGSAEYNFWMHFLSITSPSRQNQFSERVSRSKDGFISWDFLLPEGWVPLFQEKQFTSIGDQYHDVITSQHNILRALIRPDPKSNFDIENVKILHNRSRIVRDERMQQLQKFKKDYNDPNFAIMTQLFTYWTFIEWTLNQIVVNRYLELKDVRRKVTFYKDVEHRYEYKTYSYPPNTCVNLDPTWINKTNSLEVYDQCVTLFSKKDCTGETVNMHPLARGLPFLSAVNFDEKTVSFRECQSNTEVRSTLRPIFYLPTYEKPYYNGNNRTFPIKTGECQNLPRGTNASISSLVPDDQCYLLYTRARCSGRKLYISSATTSWYTDLRELDFDQLTKSIKTCDLMFQGLCNDRACPELLKKDGFEYNFWILFLSIYSQSYRIEFANRVKRSKDGNISWDFLFPMNTTTTTTRSMGDDYQDALESQRNIIRALSISRPGKWGFTKQNVETLRGLAATVSEERWKQSLEFGDGGYQDHNYVVMQTLISIWNQIQSNLAVVLKKWQAEHADDMCGLVSSESNSQKTTSVLISDGMKADYGENPWHAAIYRKTAPGKTPVLICGATLISRNVLVSAAHCFFDTAKKKLRNNTEEYEIAVGKYTRDYTVEDPFQKIYKIKELVFGPRSYNPTLTGTYGSDIMLIILKETATFDQYVRSVCLDWDGSIFTSSPNNETAIGRVAGWGLTVKNNDSISYISQYLLEADLPYISQNDCVGKINHLTNDNFCGGFQSGPALQRGDSGGGFVFKYKDRYYLRGIVSTSNNRAANSSLSPFTDVGLYLSWIRNYL